MPEQQKHAVDEQFRMAAQVVMAKLFAQKNPEGLLVSPGRKATFKGGGASKRKNKTSRPKRKFHRQKRS